VGDPDAHQVELLNEWLETCRVAYNYALRELKDWIASRKCPIDRLCDMADTIFLEDIDFRVMAKGFLGKHTVDAAFGQFRLILFYVGKQRGVYVAEVDHRGTSQTCPNCRTEVRKELGDRWHSCPECKYEAPRDLASAQEICNRGYEQLSTQGLWGKEIGCQVGLSGAMSLDKWRRAASSSSDAGSLHYNA
jgi:putative transposase